MNALLRLPWPFRPDLSPVQEEGAIVVCWILAYFVVGFVACAVVSLPEWLRRDE